MVDIYSWRRWIHDYIFLQFETDYTRLFLLETGN